jgi:hypothetical protein
MARRLAAVGDAVARDMVVRGAAIPRNFIFDYQSFHDTTQLSAALQAQAVSQSRILPVQQNGISKPLNEQVTGVGFALHPSSQTPVAVAPNRDGGGSGGSAVILKPGQVYYPGGEFRSFDWGLPYGWLGGGLAQLLVICEKDADLFWTTEPEVIFHRVTLPIYETAANPANISPNWPMRFPWPNAISNSTGAAVAQGDQPALVVVPTRTVLRPRLTSLAGALNLRLSMWQTEDLDYEFGGLLNGPAVTGSYIDTSWAAFVNSGFTINGAAVVEWPEKSLPIDVMPRIAGDNAIVAVIDTANALAAVPLQRFIDVVRYGRIGG